MGDSFDPRIIRLTNWIQARWMHLPEKRKDQIWSLLRKIYHARQIWRNRTSEAKHSSNIEEQYIEQKIKKPLPVFESDWNDLLKWKECLIHNSYPSIDVIMPVYEGYDETLRCLYSILKAENNTKFELIVVNDASPNAKLVAKLNELADKFHFTLIHNKENKGFVKTMNEAMLLHAQRDVIWVNSDIEVFNGWVDRLCNVSQKNSRIATITPFSNNATLCSYPKFFLENNQKLEIDDEIVDNFCVECNSDFEIEDVVIPTGVGFCMYVRRQALNEVGLLDSINFEKGYGEECDLCQRFQKHGWLNIALPSMFVRHYGGVSFGSDKEKLISKNEANLLAKQPDYTQQCQTFILMDPLKKYRVRLDCKRLIKSKYSDSYIKANRKVLIIGHSRGGGTGLFLKNIAYLLDNNSIPFFFLMSNADGSCSLSVGGETYENLNHLSIDRDADVFSEIVKSLGITDIQLNSIIDFPLSIVDLIERLCKDSNLKLWLVVHDYEYLCPHYALIQPGKNFQCSNFSAARCNMCSKLYNLDPTWKIRHLFERLGKISTKIIVPSNSTRNIYEQIFPDLKFSVVRHWCSPKKNIRFENNPYPRTIGIVGAINEVKGFNVVVNLAKYIKTHAIDLKLVLIGYSCNNRLLDESNVYVSGKYLSTEELICKLKEFQVDRVFIPSVCSETFCYTLTEVSNLGLPVLVFDIGAQAERLRECNCDKNIIPIDFAMNAEKLLAFLTQKNLSQTTVKEYCPSFNDYFFE